MSENKEFLTGYLSDRLPKLLYGVSILGAILCGLHLKSHYHEFFFSYLTGFVLFLALSLGAMFFVIVQYATRAGWSVLVRRVPEVLMKNIDIVGLFSIPILLGMYQLFHWTDAAHVAHDPILLAKKGYLNIPFFLVRFVGYWGVWYWLSNTFFKKSVAQDDSGDENLTAKLQSFSAPSIVLFGLTITFASFDWIMSITPHWFSTIFGVYIFAGACVVSLCVISILLMTLKKAGFLKKVTVEHFHDLGKLLYGFNIFWTYIAFSQYFLIWYANIPEETIWFMHHFSGSWEKVAAFLAIGHFGIPFVLFMSRHAKRNLKFHLIMAIWIIIMQYIDFFWIIMPSASHTGHSEFHFSLLNLGPVLLIGGVYFAVFFKRLSKVSLFPNQDPRLKESIHFHNV